jgi:hypothetical protein
MKLNNLPRWLKWGIITLVFVSIFVFAIYLIFPCSDKTLFYQEKCFPYYSLFFFPVYYIYSLIKGILSISNEIVTYILFYSIFALFYFLIGVIIGIVSGMFHFRKKK